MEKLGFGIVAFACTTCNGMSGALDPKIQQEIIDRDLYATVVLSGNRNFDATVSIRMRNRLSSLRLLWSLPTHWQVASVSILKTTYSALQTLPRNPPERYLTDRRRNRCHRCRICETATIPRHLYPDVRHRHSAKSTKPAVRLATDVHLHPPSALLGRRTGRGTYIKRYASAA